MLGFPQCWWLAYPWDTALDTTADFLAVSEHRLIPARVRSESAGLRRGAFTLSGSLRRRKRSMLGMPELGLLA